MNCTATRHDTVNAYGNHGCRCPAAREAWAAYNKQWRHRVHRGERLHVDATGTRRRIRALQARGWRAADLAQHLRDVDPATVLTFARKRHVHVRTAAAVSRVYLQLRDQRPPRPCLRNQRLAQREGWLGPEWWDDQLIDDPDYDPRALPPVAVDEVAVHRAMAGDRTVRLTSAERALAVELLTARGLSASEIADRLGVTERTVSRYRARTKTAVVRVDAGLIPFTARTPMTPPPAARGTCADGGDPPKSERRAG